MANHLHKQHNVNLLMYHIVSTVKYRKSLLTVEVSEFLKQTCIEISQRYEIYFLEIGTDQNHVHFLVQSVPRLSPSKIVQVIKGNISKQIFTNFPEVKKELWGGEFWTDGYYINTVSQYGGEKTISRYIQNQGKNIKSKQTPKSEYKTLHQAKPIDLFDQLGV